MDTLAKIAGGLGIPPGELMRGIEWTPGEVISDASVPRRLSRATFEGG